MKKSGRFVRFIKKYAFVAVFLIAVLALKLFGISFGVKVGKNFGMFLLEMIMFLPAMFILIGLIDVWFPKEKVERHIGSGSGVKGSFLMIPLAMLQAGPLYGAFPVCYILWKKGCSIRNIFLYLGAFSSLKIPMLTFEMGFLGVKFTLLRTGFTLPVFIVIALIMEKYLAHKNFEVRQPTGV